MSHSATATSSDIALENILTLQHPTTNARSASVASTSPLTLIEDTMSCAADFLLLQAITTFLSRNKSAAPDSPQPAVVLCTFKQSALHYTHIARKWVSRIQRACIARRHVHRPCSLASSSFAAFVRAFLLLRFNQLVHSTSSTICCTILPHQLNRLHPCNRN